jgi:glycosyltransferase involved in cell wall biosynthesis
MNHDNSRRRKRLLYVTTYDPGRSELGGASWVDRRILATLRENYEIETFLVSDERLAHPIPLEVGRRPVLAFRTLFRMISRREPYQAAKFRMASAWRSRVAELRERARESDLIVTSQWPALLIAEAAEVIPALHIAHNVDSVLSETYDPRLFRLLRNAARMRELERSLVNRPRAIVALSTLDCARLSEWGVVAEHLRLVSTNARAGHGRSRLIGFVGKSSWPPNAHAIEALSTRILPGVAARMGENSPELLLVGRGVSRWAGIPSVEAIEHMDDLSAFYERIDLVVIPRIETSTGVSVKMLEAIEAGVSVIVPRSLANAADVEPSVIVADTPEQMEDAIVRHFSQSHLGGRIANDSPAAAIVPTAESVLLTILEEMPDEAAN